MSKNQLTFLLPRRKNSGLNNVMCLLAAQVNAAVVYVDSGTGYHPWATIRLFWRLRAMKKAGYRVHSSGVIPDFLNRLSGTRHSSTTVHNFLEDDYVYQYGYVKGKVVTAMHVWALNGISKVIGCSEAVTKNLASKYAVKSTPCLNGCSEGTNREDVAELPATRKYFFAGPLIPRKRVLLSAIAISSNDPTAAFTIFGSGIDATKVMAAVPENFALSVGTTPRPQDFYEFGQFYISFSAFEGLPLGTLEALKEGMIPLLSSIPPHEEILKALRLPELKTFSSATEAVAWASGLTNAERVDIAGQVRNVASQVFSARSFSTRFLLCLENRTD